jgi:acetamidase/formamidase
MQASALQSPTSTIHIASDPESVLWGVLPSQNDPPLRVVDSASIISVDTLSHEGVLEDQGSDPVAFFGAQGVPREQVLRDAVNLVSQLSRPSGAGPHIVNKRIDVVGAKAGDYLQVDVVRLQPRVPYGIISNRHGKGVLSDIFPQRHETVSIFARQILHDGRMWGVIDKTGPDAISRYRSRDADKNRSQTNTLIDQPATLGFPLHPFLGIMGVTPATDEHLNTVPPGNFGGNIDINLLVEGSSLFLPIQVDGAGFYTGDPHFAQGNGEVSLTALEASLHAELRLTLIPRRNFIARFGQLQGPMVETPDYLVTTGRALTLDEALRNCVSEAILALTHLHGMDETHAYALASACVDFNISEAVDIVKGVHACIPKNCIDIAR